MLKKLLVTVITFLSLTPAFAQHSADAAAHVSRLADYRLIVDDKGPGSSHLLRGEYDAAIVAASAVNPGDPPLSAQLTLCAAYLGKRELEKAERACDMAVELARKPITTARYPHGHTNRDGLAKALSNRGVRFALQGNHLAAKDDFENARKQRRQQNAVRHNLQRVSLDSRLASKN